jgi:uncharacterized protein (DUF1800 family)
MIDRDRIAITRYGVGPAPHVAPTGAAARLLAEASAPPPPLPVPVNDTATVMGGIRAWLRARSERDLAPDDRRARVQERTSALQAMLMADAAALAAAWVEAPLGFAERLAWFWADHFSARPRSAPYAAFFAPHLAQAIRPHVTGRFADLLFAAVTHPAILAALDQAASVGPQSDRARAAEAEGRRVGLNENLARELLELHTLGVGGAYTQDDVRELAKLLTGLGADAEGNPVMRPRLAEPGAETVLGRRYGGGRRARIEDIRALTDDLAVHPDTARHIAAKLARHFIADTPDPGLVATLERAFRDSGGALPAVYAAMLAHPAAWADTPAKVRRPAETVLAAWRALGLRADDIAALPPRRLRAALLQPLAAMGQPWARPPGPQGWPEDGAAWITPQGLAARIDWAMALPWGLPLRLPDPRAFRDAVLGPDAGAGTAFAVDAAESQPEGLGLVLASPAFNRR